MNAWGEVVIWISTVNVNVSHHPNKELSSLVLSTQWNLAILSLLTSKARGKISLVTSLASPVVSVMTVVCTLLCFVEENLSSVSLTWPFEGKDIVTIYVHRLFKDLRCWSQISTLLLINIFYMVGAYNGFNV